MKEPPRSGFEVDCVAAKHRYKYTSRPGVAAKAKRQINRRARRRRKASSRLASAEIHMFTGSLPHCRDIVSAE